MKITYTECRRKEIVAIHCPKCGERVRSVGLDPEECSIDGLSCRCKRCAHIFAISASTKK